ncbi:MAG: hypothetical protein GX896_00205, partial [Clostridiales bacterium]|nr:hypothetical protein [Clostridiales bacterium]
FMMISMCMSYSVRTNLKTQNYDEEIDKQNEEAERYNPMGAYGGQDLNSSDPVSLFNDSVDIDFQFGARKISFKTEAYQVKSNDVKKGFTLKFFSNIKPDTANHKYWVRLINATDSGKTFYLYLPDDDRGSFYTATETEPYTDKFVKVVPAKSSRSIGFNGKPVLLAGKSELFKYSDVDMDPSGLTGITFTNLNDWCVDGYIDLYYAKDASGNDKFMTKTDYENLIATP